MISIGYKGLELQILVDLDGINELKKLLNSFRGKKGYTLSFNDSNLGWL